MNKFLKTNFLINIIFLFTITNFAYAEIKTYIVAKVGSEIVTNFDIENKIKTNLLLSGEKINQQSVDKIKSFTINSVINLKLKKNEIKKYNLKINNEAINQHIETVSNNLNINKIELINQFKINKIDYEKFLEDIETEFLWQRLVAQTYIDRIQISKEQIDLEINEILKNNKEITAYNLKEIEVIVDNSNNESELINEIIKNINAIGFEKTASKFSTSTTALNAGRLGWINENQLSINILQIINKLQIGQVSKPFKKANTITFLKLVDKKKLENKTDIDLNNLRISLENSKKTELLNLYSNSHLSKIKNTTLIKYE